MYWKSQRAQKGQKAPQFGQLTEIVKLQGLFFFDFAQITMVSTILFWIGSLCVMKSGSSRTIGDIQDSGWTPMSHPGTSQRRKPTKKDHGYCMVVSG